MPNKFSRTNFTQQNVIDGVTENDLAFNNYDSYTFKRPRTYFTITDKYRYRPDLIAFEQLGSVSYWWIIMKINRIDDVYNDMYLGQSIQIPSLAEVEAFYIQTRRETDL